MIMDINCSRARPESQKIKEKFPSFFPNQNLQVPRVPYSLFINQVNDGEVKMAYITQDQIRYELASPAEL